MNHELRIDDELIVDIKRLGINGEGIAFYKKLAIFVDGVIPNEQVKIKLTKVDEKMAFGEVVELIKSNSARITPKCPHYGVCGACQTAHINYEKMLEFKRDSIIEALTRYTTINPRSFEIRKTIGMDDPYHYRNKASLQVKSVANETKVCMLQKESNMPVVIDDCNVQSETINKVVKQILKIIDKLEVPLYVPKYNRGVLRYIVCRVSYATNQVLVCFVCNEKNSKIKELAIETSKLENVASVYENFNTSMKDGIIFGDETNHLCKDEFIIETIGDYKFRLKPTTFFQLNTTQTKKMYDEVKRLAKLSFKETVLDAYCGVGTIGLYIAKMAKEVIGIEYNKESVEQANLNATLNKIKNAKFLQGDTAELLPKLISQGQNFDVAIVDPPRTGLGETLCKTLLNAKIKRIIYVSCNPSTFAKDLAILDEAYTVKQIQPIDMFPQTSLVECVVLLELKSKRQP